MQYEELKEIGVLLNGGHVAGWKNNLATLMGKGFSTIRRWAVDTSSIPPSAVNHLRTLYQQKLAEDYVIKEEKLELPKIDIKKLSLRQKEDLKNWCLNILVELKKEA